jgi:hypothetical protein
MTAVAVLCLSLRVRGGMRAFLRPAILGLVAVG